MNDRCMDTTARQTCAVFCFGKAKFLASRIDEFDVKAAPF